MPKPSKANAVRVPPSTTEAAPTDSAANAVRPARDLTAPAGFVWLRHDQIAADPNNARKVFDEAALAELADSMATRGLLQKPAVRPAGEDGLHPMVLGERRWRAWGALIADGRWPADHVELCPLLESGDAEAEAAGLIENLQRRDLKPLEEARGFARLIEVHGETVQTLAAKIGFTDRFVQQRLQLLDLTADDKVLLQENKINIEEARKRLSRYPKPLDWPAGMVTTFLEMAHRAAAAGKGIGYSEEFAVGFAADSDPTVAKLQGAQAIYVHSDYRAEGVKIAIYHAGRAALAQYAGCGTPYEGAVLAALNRLRAEAGEDPFDGVYATAWLNPPFDPDPAKVEEVRERKARNAAAEQQCETDRAERIEAAKRDEAAGAAFLAAVEAFEAVAAGLDDAEFQAQAAALTAQDFPGPYALVFIPAQHNSEPIPAISSADGRAIFISGGMLEGWRRFNVICLNRIMGHPVTSGLAYGEPQAAEAPPSREAFVQMLAGFLDPDELLTADEAYDKADCHLEEFLADNEVEFGDEDFDWSAEGAKALAGDIVENLARAEGGDLSAEALAEAEDAGGEADGATLAPDADEPHPSLVKMATGKAKPVKTAEPADA